jgi:hypothetical protein
MTHTNDIDELSQLLRRDVDITVVKRVSEWQDGGIPDVTVYMAALQALALSCAAAVAWHAQGTADPQATIRDHASRLEEEVAEQAEDMLHHVEESYPSRLKQ